jgi:hypothetical protein
LKIFWTFEGAYLPLACGVLVETLVLQSPPRIDTDLTGETGRKDARDLEKFAETPWPHTQESTQFFTSAPDGAKNVPFAIKGVSE